MAGQVQLLSSGPQDVFFTINPDYSYFVERFAKHSPFAREYVDFDPETSVDFGSKVNFVIPHNAGDLINTLSVRLKLPAIPDTNFATYIESVGHAVIEYVDLIIGGKIIQRIPSDYLQIYTEHFVTQTKQQALKKLIGKYPERTISSRVSDKEILASVGRADEIQEFFVDIPFYFYNNPGLAIPLCAIKKQDVEVEIKLRDYDHLIIKDTTGELLTSLEEGRIYMEECKLCAEMIFLDPCERIKVENLKKDFIITQIQTNVFNVDKGETSGSFKLDFVNPVKELYFVIQRQGDLGTSEGQFITPFDYDNTLRDTGDKYILYENLDNLTLTLDGQPIITEETGNVIFLKAVQAAIHHSKTQLIRRFYSYSFALEPEKWYPTGQINFSFVKEQLLRMNLTPCADYARQIRVYAINYNILRIDEDYTRTLFDIKY
jgi:hypothetical protein